MEFTGERFIPQSTDSPSLAKEHWHRYYLSTEYIKGKTVLDIACGAGYGTQFLANYADKVYGMDISEESIEYAKVNFSHHNATFQVGSIAEIPLEDKSIDVIVCFETIEHIDEELQYKALNEFRRVLKEDGILIISTPNMDSENYNAHNQFHIKEFHTNEYVAFLEKQFKYVNYVGQDIRITCSLYNNENAESKIYYSDYPNLKEMTMPDKANALYLVAICSNDKPVQIPNSILVDNTNSMLKQQHQHYRSLMITLEAELNKYQDQFEHYDKVITQLSQQLNHYMNLSAEKQQQIDNMTKI